MKAETKREIRVGFFVFIGLVLFALGIFFIGKQNKLFEDKYKLWTSFDRVEGLVSGAPVRLAGLEVGIVTDIKFPKALEKTEVIVEMKIDRRVMERIREDSLASINTMGLMGDKYIEISIGTSDKPIIKEGDKIKNVNPPNYFEILDKGSLAFNKLTKVADSLDEILSRINRGEGIVGQLLTEKGKYSESLSKLGNAVDKLNQIFTQLSEGKGTIGKLLQDDELSKDVKGSFTSLHDILEAIKSGEGTLGALIYHSEKYEKMLDDLQKTSQSLAKITQSVEDGEGLLGSLIKDPKQKEILNDMQKATSSLKETLMKIENGEGTLGALINDPTVYEDIKTIISGAKESKLLRWFIKHSKKKGEKIASEEEEGKE